MHVFDIRIYPYIHVYLHTYIRIHLHMFMHTYIHAHLRAYLHVHVDIYISAHVIYEQVCGFGVQEAADVWATRRQAQVVSHACKPRYL